jgi:hypothetical protein
MTLALVPEPTELPPRKSTSRRPLPSAESDGSGARQRPPDTAVGAPYCATTTSRLRTGRRAHERRLKGARPGVEHYARLKMACIERHCERRFLPSMARRSTEERNGMRGSYGAASISGPDEFGKWVCGVTRREWAKGVRYSVVIAPGTCRPGGWT